MRLPKLFKSNRLADGAHALYVAIMGQSLKPEFYLHAGVPDTLAGRFDLLVIHAFLVMRRLKREAGDGRRLSRALYDVMFADMDRMWRELGVGDFGIGHKVNRMSKAFFGRIAAYEAALQGGDEQELADALRRNLYGTVEAEPQALMRMAAYLRREDAALAGQPVEKLFAGAIAFGPPPEPEAVSG